jgi:hypothetical protein
MSATKKSRRKLGPKTEAKRNASAVRETQQVRNPAPVAYQHEEFSIEARNAFFRGEPLTLRQFGVSASLPIRPSDRAYPVHSRRTLHLRESSRTPDVAEESLLSLVWEERDTSVYTGEPIELAEFDREELAAFVRLMPAVVSRAKAEGLLPAYFPTGAPFDSRTAPQGPAPLPEQSTLSSFFSQWRMERTPSPPADYPGDVYTYVDLTEKDGSRHVETHLSRATHDDGGHSYYLSITGYDRGEVDPFGRGARHLFEWEDLNNAHHDASLEDVYLLAMGILSALKVAEETGALKDDIPPFRASDLLASIAFVEGKKKRTEPKSSSLRSLAASGA